MNKIQLPTRQWNPDLKTALNYKDNYFPWAYAVILTFSEFITVNTQLQYGIGFHVLLMIGLFIHAALCRNHPGQQLYMALSLAPLIRILSLSMPMEGVPQIYCYLYVSLPLLAAAITVMRLSGYRAQDTGLVAGNLPLQLAISLLGLPLGLVEYLILRPDPLILGFTLQHAWLPGLILLLCTGFTEEFIFRGVMFRSAMASLGRWQSILYVSIVFSVMHINYNSPLLLIFIFTVGFLFTSMVSYSKSILGVSLAHALINIGLYLVWPLVLNNGI